MHSDQFDIVIVGAGIVGCMLANLLSKRLPHLSVALIDKQKPKQFKLSDDIGLRVYAINHASRSLFEEAGVWASIQQQRSCAYQHMVVWEQGIDQQLSFSASEINQQDLGSIVEHDLLHHSLYASAQAHSALRIFCPASVHSVDIDVNNAKVELDNGVVLTTKLVVAADGADSVVRKLANISVNKNSYLQSAIVGVVETEKPHKNTAWQRFLQHGPLAFLPLDDGSSSIVWSVSQQEAEELMNCTSSAFAKAVAEKSQYQLGQIKKVGKRGQFKLQHIQSTEYTKPRLALVGDAAHVMHPLAGQGLNLGLGDVNILLDSLSEAYKQNIDIGQYLVLKRYARQSKLHNSIMSEAFGGLNTLFSSQHSLLQVLRKNGLMVINKSQLLKRFFISQAIGKI